jgi:N utilization substance protein B
MGARSTAREAALQMLFAIDSSGAEHGAAIADFWRESPGDAEDRSYADQVVRGVCASRAELDEHITKASTHWRIERMPRVDRNVLRLGTWELLRELDVPRAVILDEAVELAKRYGTEDSGAFVNGVLDRLAESFGRYDSDQPPDPEPS